MNSGSSLLPLMPAYIRSMLNLNRPLLVKIFGLTSSPLAMLSAFVVGITVRMLAIMLNIPTYAVVA
jgi:hypothetical protein